MKIQKNKAEARLKTIERKPLVFNIRQLRKQHEGDGLTQRRLSVISGVSTRQLRVYENSRSLSKTIKNMLSITLALKIPMECLISNDCIEQLDERINLRRFKLTQKLESRNEKNRNGCAR